MTIFESRIQFIRLPGVPYSRVPQYEGRRKEGRGTLGYTLPTPCRVGQGTPSSLKNRPHRFENSLASQNLLHREDKIQIRQDTIPQISLSPNTKQMKNSHENPTVCPKIHQKLLQNSLHIPNSTSTFPTYFISQLCFQHSKAIEVNENKKKI